MGRRSKRPRRRGLLFLLALAAVLAFIYLLFSVYARSELKKTSILSAIRDD